MRRREFITVLGSATAAWPIATRALQAAGVRHIAVLMGYAEGDQEGQTFVAAFQEELQKLGWIEGHTLKIDTRWASPREPELRQRVAAELVALRPDLILSHGTPVTATLLLALSGHSAMSALPPPKRTSAPARRCSEIT